MRETPYYRSYIFIHKLFAVVQVKREYCFLKILISYSVASPLMPQQSFWLFFCFKSAGKNFKNIFIYKDFYFFLACEYALIFQLKDFIKK